MGLATWKNAPDGKIRRADVVVAKNYLNEAELTELNRIVTMYLDYAGDAQAGSDIDVLVVLAGPVKPAEEIRRTIRIVADLSLAQDVVLSCMFVSVDDYDHGGSPLLRNARREGVDV